MKYFLYARKSTEDKNKQVQSIQDQIDTLKSIAQERGLEIIEVIIDERTAKSPGRKGFTSMVERIKRGEAQGILCWKLDRLARNMIDGGTVIWLLQEEAIAEIVTPHKLYLPSENTLVLNVEFGMATQFSRDLKVNVERGMKAKVEQGWFPARAPIGYLNEPHAIKGNRKILNDPSTFSVIQHLWQTLLLRECSMKELYDYMEEESPLYRNGALFSRTGFDALFHNKFYCGIFTWSGTEYVGAHIPMITQKEFERAQQILHTGKGLRTRTLQFDLKGLFHCGCCDALITAESHTKHVKSIGEIKEYKYYRCGHRKAGITCREKPLAEAKVERQILDEIEKISIPNEILEFGLQTLNQMESSPKETSKETHLQKEIDTLSSRIKTMENNLAEEPDREIRATIYNCRNEIKVQKNALEQDLQKAKAEKENPHKEIKNRLELILHAKQTFQKGTAEQKKNVVRGLGLNWLLTDQKLHYEPHYVSLALAKTKQSLLGGMIRFEPSRSQSRTSKSLCLAEIKDVWYRLSIRRLVNLLNRVL